MKTYYMLLLLAIMLNYNTSFSQIPLRSNMFKEHYNVEYNSQVKDSKQKFLQQDIKKYSISNILNPVYFDSTSVIDSVIITHKDDTKEKYIFMYDSASNLIVELFQTWDGIQGNIGWRKNYTYNSNNKLIFEEEETWEEGLWHHNSQISYLYDSNQKLISLLYKNWSQYENQWKNNNYKTYFYDSNYNTTQILEQLFRQDQWQNYKQETYEYDSGKNKTKYLLQYWNDLNGNWGNNIKHSYTYNSSNNLEIDLREMWLLEWQNISRTSQTYDLSGNVTMKLFEEWDNEEWEKSFRDTYLYDLNNNMTFNMTQYWSYNQWENRWSYSYSYDNDKRTIELYEMWDSWNEVWENIRLTNYLYDIHRNKVQVLEEEWNKYDLHWNNKRVINFIYDLNNNMTFASSSEWDDDQWVKLNSKISFWDTFGRFYEYYGMRIEAFYNTVINIVDKNLNNTSFSLQQNYPNPFNAISIINYSIPEQSYISLKLFDVLGKEIMILVSEQKLKGNYKILFDASSLPSGVYFYKLQSGSFSETKKLMLIK